MISNGMMLFAWNREQRVFGGFARVKEVTSDMLKLRMTGNAELICINLQCLRFDNEGVGWPDRINVGMKDQEGNGWGLVNCKAKSTPVPPKSPGAFRLHPATG